MRRRLRLPELMESHPALSIIIPSYNEELRLPPSLELIADYIEKSGRATEVLVVDDGSTDKTAAVAGTLRSVERRKSRQGL